MPSHHSSSSHSSSFHSSSSHSSGRSFSSSSHSSSYRSSGRSSSFGNSSSYRSSPSRHSRTSHSGFSNNSSYRNSYSNQRFSSAQRYYRGSRHTYFYYPIVWTDSSGRSYQPGYYDETGQYYKNIQAPTNNVNTGVVCKCAYCGASKIVDTSKTPEVDLTCASCGATMEIESAIDNVVEQPNTGYYDGTQYQKQQENKFWNFLRTFVTIAVICVIFFRGCSFIRSTSHSSNYNYNDSYNNSYSYSSNVDKFGEIIHVSKGVDGYGIVNTNNYDYELVWSDYDESYYCEELKEYFWMNDNVTPNVWQYWTEDISGDFGEYGWMEHDNEGWWIETASGKWEIVPSYYDTSKLIWIN